MTPRALYSIVYTMPEHRMGPEHRNALRASYMFLVTNENMGLCLYMMLEVVYTMPGGHTMPLLASLAGG